MPSLIPTAHNTNQPPTIGQTPRQMSVNPEQASTTIHGIRSRRDNEKVEGIDGIASTVSAPVTTHTLISIHVLHVLLLHQQ